MEEHVAREFVVYLPANGCHTTNIIPVMYLQMLKQLEPSEPVSDQYDVIVSPLDTKDACLQVPQEHVVSVSQHGTEYVVLLPGQRLGVKAWYWFYRTYVTESMQFECCTVQICLAKHGCNVFMLHVDD